MSKLTRLSTEEMRQAMIHFTECQVFVTGELIEDDKTIINKWIDPIVLTINPCYSLRPDALEIITDSIFNNPIVRDFVLEVAFRFFSTWGDHDDAALRLSANIAQGLTLDGPIVSFSQIPENVRDSMPLTIFSEPSEEKSWFSMKPAKRQISVEDFLCSNKHLLVVYMIYLTNTNAIGE